MSVTLTEVDTVIDDATLRLAGAVSVATAEVGGATYIFAAGPEDDGVSVFSLDANGALAHVGSVGDGGDLELEGASLVHAAEIGGTTFLFVGGFLDNGVSVFSVGADGSLANVENLSNDPNDDTLNLSNPRGMTTVEIGGTTYLYVSHDSSGASPSGISVYSVSNGGVLTHVQNAEEDATVHLAVARGLTSVVVGSTTYLIAAGWNDNGLSVFSVGNDGTLTNVENLADDGTVALAGPRSVAMAEVGGTTFLFVAAEFDEGVSVFSIDTDGSLTNVDNATIFDTALELDGASSVSIAEIAGTTYLLVAAFGGISSPGAVTVFSVANDGALTRVTGVADDASLAIDGSRSLVAVDVDGTTYAVVPGSFDDGISVFSVLQGIHGTPGDDVLTGDAGNDTIFGYDGNDLLNGEDGNDTIDGGEGDDMLDGGTGIDTLIGGAGDDTLDGGTEADFLLGGVGDDVYRVDDTFDLVDEGCAFPAFPGDAGDFDTIISTAEWFWDVYSVAERMIVDPDAEGSGPGEAGTTIVGSIFDNEMIGNAGTNIMFGRGGADTYRGGDGTDWMSLSLLGLTDQNAYAGVDGVNTIIVDPRQSGAFSYDIVFEYEPGKDKADVSAYGYSSAAEVLALGVDDGAGNSYFPLGDGLDYLYLVGVTTSQMSGDDFLA